MATSPITTPAQAQQILDLSNAQFNNIRNYLGINDYPYQPERTYIVFDAASGNNTLHIDIGSSTSYSILKGDGTSPTSYTDTGGDKTLNYAVAGRYLIVIDGDFNGIDTTGASAGDKGKYIAVIGGTNYPTTIVADAFNACENLEMINFKSVISTEDYSFKGCLLLQFINLPKIITRGYKDFENCPKLSDQNKEYTYYNTGIYFNIAGISGVKISALDNTDFAFIDLLLDNLETYQFNGREFSKVGNSLNIAGLINSVAIAALNSTDIAYFDEGNLDLRTYRFDGTDWVQVGNDLNISGATNGTVITALNSTDIAYFDGANLDLRTYRFDGTDWAQVGNDLNISTVGIAPQIQALNGTDIVLTGLVTQLLHTYRFDGTDWAQVGNSLDILTNPLSMTSLDENTIAVLGQVSTHPATNHAIVTYRFDGTDWGIVDIPLLTGINFGSNTITRLNNKIIAIGNTDKNLRVFVRTSLNKWRV